MKTIWIFSGESSGDLYGAHLAAELKRQQPDVVVRGMGAQAMRAAGVEILVDSSELGVVGLVEVFKHLRMFLRLFNSLVARAEAERPDAVVLIDYPGFNLRFAKQMRKRGIPVVYYISPQVWAWGKKRIPEIARDVTRMLVIFPFEPQVYAGTGLDVCFVGHPLKEILAARRDPALVRAPDTVLLLPGSRNSELDRLLAPFVATAAWLKVRNPQLKFVLATPNERIAKLVTERLAVIKSQIADSKSQMPEIEVVTGKTQEWMQRATCGLAASGTVTMECAMLGLPLVVAYRMNPVTVFLGRLLVKLPYFTIVNLVANRCVFQEFLQGDVCPKVLGPALEAILPGGARRAEVEAGMTDAVTQLGERTNASALAAAAVLEVAEGQAGRDAKPAPQRTNWKKRLLWTLMLLVLLPVLTVTALAILSRLLYPWPEPPPGVNLTPLYTAIPKSELKPDNAVYYLARLKPFRIADPPGKTGGDVYEEIRFSACGWEPGQYPLREAAEKEFAFNLDLLRQAAAAKEARMTRRETVKDVGNETAQISSCIAAARYLPYLASRAASRGDWEQVGEFVGLCMSFDRALSGGGVLMDRLVSFASSVLAVGELRRAVLNGTPPPDWLHTQIAILANAETVPFEDTLRNEFLKQEATVRETFIFVESDIGENLMAALEPENSGKRCFVRQLSRFGLLPLFGSTPSWTAHHIRNTNASMLANWNPHPQVPKANEDEDTVPRLGWIELFNDPVGKISATLLLHNKNNNLYRLLQSRFFQQQATLRGTSLILALRLYQLEHDDKLPAKLEELVAAGCLKTLPDDPFAPPGTTFGYRANPDGSFAVWSRGKDLKDDGGAYDPAKAASPGSWSAPDIVFPSTEARDRRAKWQREHQKR